jgi:hypothetical protein
MHHQLTVEVGDTVDVVNHDGRGTSFVARYVAGGEHVHLGWRAWIDPVPKPTTSELVDATFAYLDEVLPHWRGLVTKEVDQDCSDSCLLGQIGFGPGLGWQQTMGWLDRLLPIPEDVRHVLCATMPMTVDQINDEINDRLFGDEAQSTDR